MLSKRLFTTEPQTKFITNAEKFLSVLSENDSNKTETLKDVATGVCRGLTLALIRAWRGGKEQVHKHVHRYDTFSKASQDQITSHAILYKKYQQFHIALADGKIPFLHQLLKDHDNDALQNKIKLLIKNTDELQVQELLYKCRRTGNQALIEHNKACIKNTILLLRKQREQLIHDIFIGLESADLQAKAELEKELKFAKEIYIFIHSILFLQKHAALNLLADDYERGVKRKANNKDIVELINMIAPDNATEIQLATSFGFTFKKNRNDIGSNELLKILKMTVHEGDLVYLFSLGIKEKRASHALFLLRQNNKWLLINPNGGNYAELTDEQLTQHINYAGFYRTEMISPNNYYSIGFHVFANTQNTNKPRHTEDALVQTILDMRDKSNTHINVGKNIYCSALDLAIRLDNPRLATAIIARGGTIRSTDIDAARSNAMRRALLPGGIVGFLKRNWKYLLLAAIVTAACIAAIVLSAGALTPLIACPLTLALSDGSLGYILYNREKKDYFDEKPIPVKVKTTQPSPRPIAFVADHKEPVLEKKFSAADKSAADTKHIANEQSPVIAALRPQR